MLPAGTAATARLQGWATLENQSGSDWKNVALTLQYGNPVTFRQSLYRSYFVQRPEVPVEILGPDLPDIDKPPWKPQPPTKHRKKRFFPCPSRSISPPATPPTCPSSTARCQPPG